MKTPSPGLAAQLAQLHHAPLGRETCAWVPAAVQDLIIAWLTRIFASLEQLVRLWQAGQLPSPPSARPCRAPPGGIPPDKRVARYPVVAPQGARRIASARPFPVMR